MAAEKRALKDGDVSLAKFLNYYGNFLGANHRSVEKIEFDLHSKRIPLYGYADRIHNKEENEVIIKNLNDAIRVSDTAWDEEVKKYGKVQQKIESADHDQADRKPPGQQHRKGRIATF